MTHYTFHPTAPHGVGTVAIPDLEGTTPPPRLDGIDVAAVEAWNHRQDVARDAYYELRRRRGDSP